MENPIKMDDLGVPLYLETPMCFFSRDKLLGEKAGVFLDWGWLKTMQDEFSLSEMMIVNRSDLTEKNKSLPKVVGF